MELNQHILLFIWISVLTSCLSEQKPQEKEEHKLKNERTEHIDEKSINHTQWINQPMSEFHNCIDTIFFIDNFFRSYSCEREESEAGEYRIQNDTVFVRIRDFGTIKSSVHTIIKESQFILSSKGIVMVYEKRKSGDKWYETKPEFLNKFYYVKKIAP